MADHVVTLTADEEATLADQVTRAQDPALTVDLLVAAIVHQDLAPRIDAFLAAQRQQVNQVLIEADSDTRQALVANILQAAPPITPVITPRV